jgi:hypothetical protein
VSSGPDKIDEVLRSIEALRTKSPDKPKDFWDKAAVVGQLISGIAIALVGYFVTTSLDHGQIRNAKTISDAQIASAASLQERQNQLTASTTSAQLKFQKFAQDASLDATNRQIVGDYFSKFATTIAPEQRAEFMDVLDVELGPRYSVPLAVRLLKARQVRDEICQGRLRHSSATDKAKDNDLVVRRAATDLLERLKVKGRQQLLEISRAGFQPDAGIADAFLERGPTVQFKVSDVDDFVDIFVNNKQIATYQFGQESGWVDISSNLTREKANSFFVQVRNSPYEGTGVRVQMKIGEYQYDRFIRRNDWTGEGPAFFIGISIPVDSKGRASYGGDNIQTTGPTGDPHCEITDSTP